MYAYLKKVSHFQPEIQSSLPTTLNWLRQLREDFRRKQAKKRLYSELSALDRHILNDIGVDAIPPTKTYPSFADLNSRIIAVGIFSECHALAKITYSR